LLLACSHKPEEDFINIFKRIIFTAKELREKVPDFDGRGWWQFIKHECQKIEIPKTASWKIVHPEFTQQVLKNFTDDVDVHHFLVQQVRIPCKEECTLAKILQIGLNIGQFLGSANNEFMKSIDYDSYHFDDIHVFLDLESIKQISLCLPKGFYDTLEDYFEESLASLLMSHDDV
jgi:hypothetical protein